MRLQTKVLLLVLLVASLFGVGQLGLIYRQLNHAFLTLEHEQALQVAHGVKADVVANMEALRRGAEAWWERLGRRWIEGAGELAALRLARVDAVVRIPLDATLPTWIAVSPHFGSDTHAALQDVLSLLKQRATKSSWRHDQGQAGLILAEPMRMPLTWVVLSNQDHSELVAFIQIVTPAASRLEGGMTVALEPLPPAVRRDESTATWIEDDTITAATEITEFITQRRLAVVVRQSRQLETTALATIVGYGAALVIGGLLLCAGFVVALRILVLHRVSRLVRYVSRVRQSDDLRRRVDDESDDEIGQLYRAFDRMCDRLDSQADQLRTANAELLEALRAKNDFLHRLSHDLRTPLTTIKGFTDKLRLGTTDGSAATAVSEISRAADHLLTLINELLDLGRARSGKLEFRLGPVDVPDLFEDVRNMVAVQAEAKGLTLTFEAPPDIPAVWADGRRLLQVMVNLVDNAVKFSDRGHVRVTAKLHATQDADWITLQVLDEGPGIAPPQLPHLFEPFDATPNHPRAGSGLGLAIAKEFVERMGGRIEVQSTVGVGSVFAVQLKSSTRR